MEPDLLSNQICPHCNYEEDPSQAEWEEGEHYVDCPRCGEGYIVRTVYQFMGFQTGAATCDWCDELATELSHPHLLDFAVGMQMCRVCWNHDREVYKGSYGEDIGEFKPIKKGV